MKVAYLINRYPAVSHSFIRREIAGVEAAGVEVARFSIRPPGASLPDAQDREEAARTEIVLAHGAGGLLGATLARLAARPGRFLDALGVTLRSMRQDRKRGWRHLIYLAEACWLAGRFEGISHLHAHFGTNSATVARLVHKLTGVPYSFTVHGPDEFDDPLGLELGDKIADARWAVAISSFGRSQLMRWSDPRHWQRIVIARCGVDRIFLEPAPASDRSAPILCAVARLSAQKGLPLLIEAAAQLVARGSDFRLILVGDGEMRAGIEAMIADKGLAQHVSITGYVDAATVRENLLASRAMVLPSFAEGLPVVIMEALALRTPVIVSAIAGTPELVDSECGWLVPAGSVDALATAMEQALAAEPARLAAMGEVGRSRVLEMHDSVRNGTDLAARFREVA